MPGVQEGDWLTVKEVASRLRVSVATVYNLCDRGELLSFRVSNSIRISRQALADFTQAR